MKNRVLTQKWIVFIFVAILLATVVENISYGQGSAKIYWTESDKIRRANLDGSNVENVLTELESPMDITLDLHDHKMYWVNFDTSKIYRANLDGSNIETIIDSGAQIEEQGKRLPTPGSIAIDTNASKIYWGNWRAPWRISRADNDGSNIEDIKIKPVDGAIFGPTVDAESLELDVKAGKMYWADSFNDNIGRANLDGSNYEELGTTPAPFGLALDLRGRHVYWTDPWIGKIKRSALNVDNVETLLTQLNGPTDIALDIRFHKMYWVQTEFAQGTSKSKIQRANLDGTNVTDILTELKRVNGIALDTEGVYDVAPDTNKLTTTWANMKSQ